MHCAAWATCRDRPGRSATLSPHSWYPNKDAAVPKQQTKKGARRGTGIQFKKAQSPLRLVDLIIFRLMLPRLAAGSSAKKLGVRGAAQMAL